MDPVGTLLIVDQALRVRFPTERTNYPWGPEGGIAKGAYVVAATLGIQVPHVGESPAHGTTVLPIPLEAPALRPILPGDEPQG